MTKFSALTLNDLPWDDMAVFAVFMALWVGYTWLADHRKLRHRTLSSVTATHRHVWMRAMCDRENRISDASLIGNLMRSVSFFASASVLILGGLVALMGAGERGYDVYRDLPFVHATGLVGFEMRALLIACVFVYAFFQFTWAMRQFNYCCILMGTAPERQADDSAKAHYAVHAARLQDLAATTFNRGLRAYYFALAMILWFVHPVVFLLATSGVIAILYRREFNSKSLSALRAALAPGDRT